MTNKREKEKKTFSLERTGIRNGRTARSVSRRRPNVIHYSNTYLHSPSTRTSTRYPKVPPIKGEAKQRKEKKGNNN